MHQTRRSLEAEEYELILKCAIPSGYVEWIQLENGRAERLYCSPVRCLARLKSSFGVVASSSHDLPTTGHVLDILRSRREKFRASARNMDCRLRSLQLPLRRRDHAFERNVCGTLWVTWIHECILHLESELRMGRFVEGHGV